MGTLLQTKGHNARGLTRIASYDEAANCYVLGRYIKF